jgi:hypothetical protein
VNTPVVDQVSRRSWGARQLLAIESSLVCIFLVTVAWVHGNISGVSAGVTWIVAAIIVTLAIRNIVKRMPAFSTEVRTVSVELLGEQDGPIERALKTHWHPILLAHPSAKKAFLVRATYLDHKQHVMLALCTGGVRDLELVRALRVPRAGTFTADCPLEIAFVKPAHESQLVAVCAPFYESV